MAGIPHMAGGSSVGQFTKQIAEAIAKYKRIHGKAPSQQEVDALHKHVASLSSPTPGSSIPTNPARLAGTTPAQNLLVDEMGRSYAPLYGKRATLTTPEQARGYEIDPFGMEQSNLRARAGLELPNKKAFENRDPFLTEAMTGRSPTRTRQKPFTTNVDDLNANLAHLESKGQYGAHTGTEPGGLPTQSTTPSADFFAQMSSGLENAKLPANIRSMLREKLGREPTEDEINSFISNMNVLRHDYTGQGTAAFGAERPFPAGRPTKQQSEEIAAYRQNAIDSGISPSALKAGRDELERDYPNLLREREWGPEGHKAGGQITTDEMRHMMIAEGHEPEHFKKGRSVMDNIKNMSFTNKAMAMLGPMDVASELKEGRPGGAMLSAADTVAGSVLPFFKGYLPFQALTHSKELGPKEGTRDWEIENPRAMREYQAQLQQELEADEAARQRTEQIAPLWQDYQSKNYPGLK